MLYEFVVNGAQALRLWLCFVGCVWLVVCLWLCLGGCVLFVCCLLVCLGCVCLSFLLCCCGLWLCCWLCIMCCVLCGCLLFRSESLHCHLALAVEFRDCPSGACCCGPVVPTAPWSLLLKSGSAHCDQTLAVEGGGREKEDEELRRLSYKSGRPHLPGGEEAKSRKGCVLLSTILRELPNILSICGRAFVYFVKAWGWIAPNGSLTPSTQLKPMKEQLVGAGTTQ